MLGAALALGAAIFALNEGTSPSGRAFDAPVHFTVAASGDLLIHSPVYERAQALAGGDGYDFSPMFRYVRPQIAGADLALCHVETPMTAARPSGYPSFNTPPALAKAIARTGWDACSTASNHSLDRGQRGIDGTIRALRRAGVRHTGSFRSAKDRRRTTILEAKGVKLGFLAYTETTNGIHRPHPWSLNMVRPSRILADARRARRRGAQAVIVNLHWGAEYRHRPTRSQLRLAGRLTRSRDITAVVGQHAHVVQPIRRVNGKLVVFGEGNFVSNQTTACCPAASQDGLIAVLHFHEEDGRARLARVRYVPTWVRHPDFTVLPIGAALDKDLANSSALRSSYRRTASVVGRGRGYRPFPARLPDAP